MGDFPYTVDVWDWHTPATEYAEEILGSARIFRGSYSCGSYPTWGIDGYLFHRVRRRIPVTSLQIKEGGAWRTWMVDDYPSYRSMQIFAENAKGRVLTTGLGLGLICHELVKNPNVEHVTVVEVNQDVIWLVRGHIPDTINLVLDDFYRFIESDHNHWDTIILDLWVSRGLRSKMQMLPEVLDLIVKLKKQHPNVELSAHGFPTLSDTRVVSDEMMELIQERRPYEEYRVDNTLRP